MAGVTLAVRDGDLPTQSYRNPFDISRRHLLDQVVRMRANFMQTNVALIKMQDQVCDVLLRLVCCRGCKVDVWGAG